MEGAGARTRTIVMVVTVVAVAARLEMVLRGGGLEGVYGYDDGVYYTAAASVVAGHVPYRDFILLHPPGMALLLAPFAVLGRLTTDHAGFVAARLAFMLLSGANAGAVAALGARWRRPGAVAAALAGGLFAALWFSSIYASRTTLLETPASSCLLGALLLLWRRRQPVGPRAQVAAGAVLGLSTTIKIWGLVPLLVVVAWQLQTSGRRAAARVLGGAAACVVAVCGVFFALSPAAMTRMVVGDQLRRAPSSGSPVQRALDASSLVWNLPGVDLSGTRLGVVAAAVVGGLVIGLCALAWRSGARLPVVLLAGCLAVLVLSPSYYTHYGELVSPPLALVVGAAAGGAAGAVTAAVDTRRRFSPLAGAAVVPLVVLLVFEVHTVTRPLGHPIDTARLRAAVAGRGCVVTETPSMLALLDVLTPDLRAGCPVPVDVTGPTYDRDARRRPDGRALPRLANRAWQRDLRAYLRSGDVVVLMHAPRQLLAADGRAELARRQVVARSGPVRVYGPARPPARTAVAAPH